MPDYVGPYTELTAPFGGDGTGPDVLAEMERRARAYRAGYRDDDRSTPSAVLSADVLRLIAAVRAARALADEWESAGGLLSTAARELRAAVAPAQPADLLSQVAANGSTDETWPAAQPVTRTAPARTTRDGQEAER